ncbi:aldehyde dehydrogenase family protein [uncultured Microbacterium sp.]|uniref:aldehyde dehydrogenase family protein n=1 Tax=uncultured Microbacterium sp. TaxID=191216 RepID=UPI0028E3BB4C|nr:aldehyde dehydrogenase family protein [uncultured Microbacterium sp.]
MTVQTAIGGYRVLNPATGALVTEFATDTDEDIRAAVDRAYATYQRDIGLPIRARTAALQRAADLLRERADEMSRLISEEMGKSLEQGAGEVEFSAAIFEYYSQNAERLTADQEIPTPGTRAVIERRPLGPLLGVMPWNYPYYQVARFAAPNLALGNTVLLKPSEWCPQSALAFNALLLEAGVPDGAYQTVLATHGQIETIIADPRVRGVSLTGSERAGAAVARAAGEHLKKVVLELGGSDAYVILDTASAVDAAETAWGMRMENLGQACNSNKRIIVVGDQFDDIVRELVGLASHLLPGDPLSLKDGEYGPLASRGGAEYLAGQVADAVAQGATLHIGGTVGEGPGAYFAPAVLTGVTPEMRAYSEELFGPVAVVYRAESEEQALYLANDTEFGLGAAVFSADVERAAAFASRVESGMVSINAPAAEGAELPFGGVQRSGFGRELGPLGIDEFVNKRLVYFA